MKRLLVLVLVLVMLLPSVVRAQEDEPLCDLVKYMGRVQDDLQYHGEQLGAVELSDLAGLGMLYVETTDTRQYYEDLVLCDDLEAVNRTVITVFSTMGDVVALNFFGVARPGAMAMYRGMVDARTERFGTAVDRMLEQFQAMME